VLVKLFKDYDNASDAEWFELPTVEPDPRGPVRLQLRQVPDGKIMELRQSIIGRKTTIRSRRGGAEEEADRPHSETQIAYKAELAAFAFVDAERLEFAPGDQGAAEQLTKMPGRPVLVGEEIPLSKALPREARLAVFKEDELLREFIHVRVEMMRAERKARTSEQGKA
jgi:hypothetical protein